VIVNDVRVQLVGSKIRPRENTWWKSTSERDVCCAPVPTQLDPAMRVPSILGFHQDSCKNLLQLACYRVPSSKTKNIWKHLKTSNITSLIFAPKSWDGGVSWSVSGYGTVSCFVSFVSCTYEHIRHKVKSQWVPSDTVSAFGWR
jgi:hypothetical protein